MKRIIVVIFLSLLTLLAGCSKSNISSPDEQLSIENVINKENIKSKEEIPIDIDLITKDDYIYLGEFNLTKKDVIIYNLTADGNGNINIGFTKDKNFDLENLLIGHAYYASTAILNNAIQLKDLNAITEGTYYLWISSYDGDLSNISGTVTIGELEY